MKSPQRLSVKGINSYKKLFKLVSCVFQKKTIEYFNAIQCVIKDLIDKTLLCVFFSENIENLNTISQH